MRTLKKRGGNMLGSFTKFAKTAGDMAKTAGDIAKKAEDTGNAVQKVNADIRDAAVNSAYESGIITTQQKMAFEAAKRDQQKYLDAEKEREEKARNSFSAIPGGVLPGGSRQRRHKKTAKKIKRKSKKTKRSRR